ncbi:conserved hypothetical protein [Theileria orientalis strain Shintoku]|uniref:Uncharacterized protein n=1 Tax=Theileria orientalis strain Shintoku TaxID=869250 RepID=J4D8D7_THEOR|nr:conserved hypothetical protein [Theileria orientalis strain Shintoku]BAM40725.1 conserved hypothetical protein [Theileria orientalis strain Shintoku]|eukprot:XP_009691026.1 conserved hypothetical protein [Theileria orientalis strain Shintoku]
MKIMYTLVICATIGLFVGKVESFELDISQVLDYSRGASTVSVTKTRELQNLYTHKFNDPATLKEIYNGDERLYFDQLLVSDQLLLSASVVWSFETPSIIQLNLEQSSVLLINEKESLDVQAIFSKKLVTNIKPRIHSDIDAIVDIDLSNISDYDSNNSKVYVTNIKFAEDRFKKYTLRNYNLESTRLGKILYNNTELKTKFENNPEKSTESNLDIPYKNNVYSIQVYAYNNFPLLIEFLYTFNKRQFYGYTPEEKWHHVVFPTVEYPAFSDLLYNRLNYYGCKNGFKYTIDINQKTDTDSHPYKINTYCNLLDEVETIENEVKLPFYTDRNYNEGKYRCFEHTPINDTRFFVDHLMEGNLVLQLPAIPKVIKTVRVYHHLDRRPYLIVFVDSADVLYYYIYEDKVWRRDKTVENVDFGERFNDDIRALLHQLYQDDIREGKRVHKLVINEEAISLMTDSVRILTWFDSEATIDTYKKDRESKNNNLLKISEFDIWWYGYYSDTTTIGGEGLLKKMLLVQNKQNCAIKPAKYYGYTIHDFDEGIYVHRIDYYHDKSTGDMTVYLYTNTLFVFVFRKNSREASEVNWKFLEVKPVKVLEMYDTYTKYYELMKKLNNFNFNVSEVVASPVNLLPETIGIKFSQTETRSMPTLKGDNLNKNLQRVEYDVAKHAEQSEAATSEGGRP